MPPANGPMAISAASNAIDMPLPVTGGIIVIASPIQHSGCAAATASAMLRGDLRSGLASDIAALIASSAALSISGIPFNGPIGAVRLAPSILVRNEHVEGAAAARALARLAAQVGRAFIGAKLEDMHAFFDRLYGG